MTQPIDDLSPKGAGVPVLMIDHPRHHLSALTLGPMVAALAAAGMMAGPTVIEIEPPRRDDWMRDDFLDLAAVLGGRTTRGVRRLSPPPKRLAPPSFRTRSTPSTATDTRDPKYLHSAARRRLARGEKK